MAKLYNFDYDIYIIDALHKKNKLRFTEIQKVIENKTSRKISPDTLNYHIKKLKSHGYIRLSIIEGKRGKSKNYSLTDLTEQDIQLGLLDINYDLTVNSFISKHGQNKNAVAYFITMCSLANSEIALIIDDENLEYGISAKDISEYYGGLFGFGYLRINEENIQKILFLLCDQRLLQKNKDSNNEDRFTIINNDLNNFIDELTTIYHCAIYPRLVLTWTHIRSPKPHERSFFDIHYGKKKAPERILHFKDLLNKNKQKDTFKKDLIIWKKRIDNFDYEIKRIVIELSEKYSIFIERYPSIAKILLEIFYPFFLKDMIKDIEKKNKNRKYLKLLMIDTNSITKSQDQAEVQALRK